MKRKYTLTDECITVEGSTLYRIRSLRTFAQVKAGDLGGYVASKENLSNDGNSWVYCMAKVSGDARVYGDGWIGGSAHVSENAHVFGNAHVYGRAQVCGDARVFDEAEIGEYANVYEDAVVSGRAMIHGCSWIFGNAHISGSTQIFGDTNICGDAYMNMNMHEMYYINLKIKLDHGVWTQHIQIDGRNYLISSTLEKILME